MLLQNRERLLCDPIATTIFRALILKFLNDYKKSLKLCKIQIFKITWECLLFRKHMTDMDPQKHSPEMFCQACKFWNYWEHLVWRTSANDCFWTHIRLMFPFHIYWKYWKSKRFLMFSGSIERERWPKRTLV